MKLSAVRGVVRGAFFKYIPVVLALLAATTALQTWRLDLAHLRLEKMRNMVTEQQADFFERSLQLERDFSTRQRARDRETQRFVTEWRRDMEHERDESIETVVCGPADHLSERTQQRLRQLGQAKTPRAPAP